MRYESSIVVAVLTAALSVTAISGCDGNGQSEQELRAEVARLEAANRELAEQVEAAREPSGQGAKDPVVKQAPEIADEVFQVILDENEELAIAMVERGAPVNARNERGVTLLHFAVRASMLELARVLLERGADPNATVSPGNHTPMHWASRVGAHDRPNARELVDLLLEHGANIEHADDNGTRPIDYATLLNHDEWREFMLSRGATP